MNTIKAVPITEENFKKYGTFSSFLENPECAPGEAIFHPNRVEICASTGMPLGFSMLTVKKAERMIIDVAEYHNCAEEGVFMIDDDAIMHVAPPSAQPMPEKVEAFIVPKGTMVRMNFGVWHYAPMPVHNDMLHIIIVLPKRLYANDCVICRYNDDQQMEIKL